MKYKTKVLSEQLAEALSSWPVVECVSLNEAALPDTLDPYFALILDVFHQDHLPALEERQIAYGSGVMMLETSGQGNKDRFLIRDIPVRVEYKPVGLIEERMSMAEANGESLELIKDAGTYGYYRLLYGEILFSRNGWIDSIRQRLFTLDPAFWSGVRDAAQSKMEHFLCDLGAAFFQEDDFHYLIASAGFIKNACLTLFCINRRFEPSHRAYYTQVRELPILPESFPAELETYLRDSEALPRERQYALAQLIARNIIALP